MRAQLFLKIVGIGELRYILELINADHYFKPLILCDFLGKVKHLIWILFYSLCKLPP